MYYLDKSLRMLLPNVYKLTEEQVKKDVKIYNIVIMVLLVIYIAMFIFVYFTTLHVSNEAALSIHVGFRILFLIIYMVTCVKLFRTLK